MPGYEYWENRLSLLYPTGLPIKDLRGNTYSVGLSLNIQDDKSDADMHASLVTTMVSSGAVDFVMNAQPSFALAEATIVSG